MVKFKLNASDFRFSCNSSVFEPSSSSNSSQSSKKHKNVSSEALSPKSLKHKRALHQSFEMIPILTINVKRFFVITRETVTPAFSQNSHDSFEFEIGQNDLSRIATVIEMILRCNDEDWVIQLLFEVRYKELVGMLKNSQDFDSEDLLLHHKVNRLLPEGLQYGAFILSKSSFHFYSLINSRPSEPIHFIFKNILFAMRYSYLHKKIGLSLYVYNSKHPIILLFENEDQRDNIYTYLQNKIKFKDPITDLDKMTDKWSCGKLSNFEYLMFLNHVANRSELDVSQYPIFPWLLKSYSTDIIELEDPDNYRDLAVPIGATNKSRLDIFQARLDKKEKEISLYPSYNSNSSVVHFYLIRKIPELLLRCQNSIYSTPEKIFTSIHKTHQSSMSDFADQKELTPEFYSFEPDFLINIDNLDVGDGKVIENVELPPWAKDQWSFLLSMRDVLETDVVSSSIHHWIDLIFGHLQRNGDSYINNNHYYPESYYVDWNSIKNDLKRKSLETQLKNFGIVPTQLFTSPHPCRIFRSNLTLQKPVFESVDLKLKVQKLQNQIQNFMIIHQKEIQAQEKQYKQLANQLKQDQDHDIKGLREKLRDVENHHKLLKEEIKEKEKMNEENFCNHIDNLRAEHEKEIMRVSKSQHAKSLEAMLSDVQVSKSIKVKGLHGVIGQSETQKSLRKTFHTKEAFPLTSRRSHSTQSVTPPKIRPSSSLGTYK